MNKQAPALAHIAAMVAFALTCFGLLLFLWVSFGGPIPLKPKGYRVQMAVPEAATLGLEADVRVAGVSVGKVRRKQLLDGDNRTLITMELDSRFAPVAEDVKAILRQKTLLGEAYIELTPGTSPRKLPENGRIADARVADSVQLDEIFQALDPETRQGFRTWQQDLAKGIAGHGQDLNDALGTLPGFAADASDVLKVLDDQEGAVTRLVKNTGVVFGALNENQGQLRNLITGANRLFQATSDQQEALAETIRIFPTFLDESKAVMARLKTFSNDTRPLIRDLQPVARDLGPTLQDVQALAPDLERTFRDLDPLIVASKKGLPALRDVLDGTTPLLGELGPFLEQLNPILEWLEANQMQVTDFISNGAGALADVTQTNSPGAIGHYLRQLGPAGPETLGVHATRLSSNRGNSYFQPGDLFATPKAAEFLIEPSFDCRNAGGETKPSADVKGCWVPANQTFQGKLQGRFPHVEKADYSK